MARRGSWPVRWFEWDDVNIEHVGEHGVQAAEVEEVFRGRKYVRRARNDSYFVLGVSATGRRLFVVVARRENGGVRPITARDMNASERRLFERRAR